MVQALDWLIFIILPCISATDTTTIDIKHTATIQGSPFSTQPLSTKDNNDLEYRLIRLESIIGEKLETLRIEARDSSRRLEALELQSMEVLSTLKDLRADMTKKVPQTTVCTGMLVQQSNTVLEQAVEDLDKNVKMLMTTTTVLSFDVNELKKNVSSFITDTRESSRCLQGLEWQPALFNSTLDVRAAVSGIVATPSQQSNTVLERAVEDLHKDVKTLKTSLTSDVSEWKENFSSFINETRSMLQSTSNFVTKHLAPSFPIGSESLTNLPKNCKEIKASGQTLTGIYTIQPESNCKPVLVMCDMQTRGGGWTVIHNRFDGSEDFYRNWHEHKYGFGNLSGEFWLGLDTINKLTGCQANELLIELQFLDLPSKTANYAKFSVGPEREGFPLKISGYSGDAGDSMTYHHGQKFSTKDVDQDSYNTNCAVNYVGAWWHKSCHLSNLNGKYFTFGEQVAPETRMSWHISGYKLLTKARMLVRPRAEAVCDTF